MGEQPVAVVSGASRGIGAATAREFGTRGYHVIVNYLSNADAAATVVKEIESAGGSAQAAQADVTDAEQVEAMINGVAEHGRIDALVVNANTAQPPFGPLVALPWEAFAAKVDGELAGAYHLTRAALAVMTRRRAGRIVYVSSTAADVPMGSIAHS